MDKNATKAAMKMHPVAASDATGRTGAYRYALITSNQSIALPAVIPGGQAGQTSGIEGWFVEIKVISPSGASVQYAFSKAAQTLVLNQAATFASPSAAAGVTLASGESRDGRIPQTMSFINFIGSSAATTGDYVEIYVSEGGS